MDIKNLRRDIAAIEAGDWVGDIPNMGSLALKVRGIGSVQYQTALARLAKAVGIEERDRDGTLLPDVALRVTGEAAAEALLLDWAGLENDGQPVPFDAKLAREWLTQPEYRHFLDAVIWSAGVMERGRRETAGTVKGN